MLDTRIPPLDQPISTLTVADLKALVSSIVRQVLREEMRTSAVSLPSGRTLPDVFLTTFGSWQDDRSTDEIVREILESRTVSTAEVTL